MSNVDSRRRRPRLATVLAVGGLAVSLLSVLLGVGRWLFPDGFGSHDAAGNPPATNAAGVLPAAAATTTAPQVAPATASGAAVAAPSAAVTGTALNDLPVESGAKGSLPRALAGKPDYAGAVVINCPTNGSSNKTTEVTFTLLGRYLDLSATVRPYVPTDPDANVFVTAVGAWRNADGLFTRREVGAEYTSTGRTPADLRGALDGAEKLTLVVRCQDPRGIVVLTDARLTRAS